MNRKLVSILMVLLGLALILPIVQAAPHTDITVAQAYAMIYSNSYPNLVIMDVRIASDYNAGHIPGAINVPVIPPSPFNFAALYTWISGPGQSHKSDEIIVYCGTGTRSNLASNILTANGFTKVYDMRGAYPAWIALISATVDIKPDTLNLESNGKWVTCYIELPTPNSANDIVVSTIRMNNIISAELRPTEIGDYNGNNVPDLMVKFDRVVVQGLLGDGEIRLVATFNLTNQKVCGGWDTIRVID